jgi:hypothetical protein
MITAGAAWCIKGSRSTAQSYSTDRLVKNTQESGYLDTNSLEALVCDNTLYAKLQLHSSKSFRRKCGVAVYLFSLLNASSNIVINVLTTSCTSKMRLPLEEIQGFDSLGRRRLLRNAKCHTQAIENA